VPPSVAVEGVRKIWDNGLEAIREVSFTIAPGRFVSLLGPSGCGKSTLLMMLAGLVSPTAGVIRIDGTPVDGPRRQVGLMFQSPVLLPWRTVRGNVLLPVEMLRLPRREYERRARDLLAMVKLEDFADKLPRELSGGMQQRVAMCRALIHAPDILLMDEPFSALDALTRDHMGLELWRIWERHQNTVVFVTHSIREAVFLSDRVLVMGRRPATITEDLDVPLPRPRQLEMQETDEFNRHVAVLRKSIEASHGL
jgi:NitT/TauT family transport system ATP-binding protein